MTVFDICYLPFSGLQSVVMIKKNLILIVLRDTLICSVILVCFREEWPVLGLLYANVVAKLHITTSNS